jgi:hypothetical protein
MDYTIITAWYDVREKENHPMKNDSTNAHFCCMKFYFDNAKLLFEKPFPMVIYTEPRFKDLILQARPASLHVITKFIFKDYEELPLHHLYERFHENHYKNKVINLSEEKFTPLYKFIISHKIEFVKQTILENPFSTPKFAWMDLRLHSIYNMGIEETNEIMDTLTKDRVKMMQMGYPCTSEIYGRHDYYSWTRGKAAAGFFGGYREPLLKFCELCQAEFLEALNTGMAPTDEMVYSYVISYNLDLFDPYCGDYNSCLINILRTRGYQYLAFNFLNKSFDRGNHYYTWKIAENLRKGFLKGEISISTQDIHNIWYYNYVANYHLRNRDNCWRLLDEYYRIASNREDVANHIKANFEGFKSMLSHMDDKELVSRFDKFS